MNQLIYPRLVHTLSLCSSTPDFQSSPVPKGDLFMEWDAAYSQHLGLGKWEREGIERDTSHQNSEMIVHH